MNSSVLQRGPALVRSSAQPAILVATAEPTISSSLGELLYPYAMKTFWVRGVEGVRTKLATEMVAICFCGFWLIDGTYRDVVRLLKRQTVEIPAVVVCSPSCPEEYREYLAALNLKAFDFLCHPYRKPDVDRILRAAMSEHVSSPRATDESMTQPGLRKAG